LAACAWSVVSVLAVVGCATTPTSVPDQDREKIVAQRAEARWQTLIKGDVDGAYAFLSPGSKVATSLAAYKGKIKSGLWREAKAETVKCDGEVCKATVRLTYDTERVKGIQTPIDENWIFENGTAWYVYR
jgi:hypothetical protein